jgi:hypothetical protein
MKIQYFLFVYLLFSCKEDQSVFEEEPISGIAVIHDAVFQTGHRPAEGVTIYLTTVEGDSSKFIYSTKSSAEGRFSFSHRPDNGSTLFLYTYYVANGVVYSSSYYDVNNHKNGAHIRIIPRYKPGIKVLVQDSLSTPLFNVNVCLYSSITQSNNLNCEGSFRSQKTNDQGVVFFENLQAGKYFLRINDKIGSKDVHGKADKEINGRGIDSVGIVVKNRTSKQIPGVNVFVTDSLNTPLANVNVCFFTSEVLAQSQVCDNSIASQKTDALGNTLFKDLQSAKYYFIVNEILDGKEFHAYGEVNHTKDSVTRVTLLAKNKPDLPPKGLQVIVVDSLSTPLTNVNVCLFTSKVLAEKRECVGHILTQKTDAFGKTLFQKLPTATYYLVVNERINGRQFNALDTAKFTSGELKEVKLVALKKP